MKPATARALAYGLGGLLVLGLLLTLAKGDAQGSRDLAVAVLVLAMFGALAYGTWRIRALPRRSATEAAARALGLRFTPTDSAGLIDRPFPLFHRLATARGIENLMVGAWRGREIMVGEYWYARSSNPALDDVQRLSWVMTPLPAWWPDLTLAPETLVDPAAAHLTMQEVNVESAAFNRAFTVRSADPRFANALLDARMVQWLLDRADVAGFEVIDGSLLCYCPRLEPWAVQPLLETAMDFLDQVPDVVSSLFPAS